MSRPTEVKQILARPPSEEKILPHQAVHQKILPGSPAVMKTILSPLDCLEVFADEQTSTLPNEQGFPAEVEHLKEKFQTHMALNSEAQIKQETTRH